MTTFLQPPTEQFMERSVASSTDIRALIRILTCCVEDPSLNILFQFKSILILPSAVSDICSLIGRRAFNCYYVLWIQNGNINKWTVSIINIFTIKRVSLGLFNIHHKQEFQVTCQNADKSTFMDQSIKICRFCVIRLKMWMWFSNLKTYFTRIL